MPRDTLTDEQIEKLRATYGEIAALETRGGTAVFRAPTREEYLESLKMHAKDQGDSALRFLATSCVVAPTAEVFGKWCDKWVAIPKACDNVINRLAGLDTDAAVREIDDGERAIVATPAGPLTFKAPDERQFSEWRRRSAKDGHDAAEYLAQCCIVQPPREKLQEMLQKWPALAMTCVPAITRLAGLEENERGK